MTLTVTEKAHWKERIGRKIKQSIAELVERNDPDYLKRVELEARSAALESLGIADLMDRRQSLDDQKKKLSQDKEEVERLLVAAVRPEPQGQNRLSYQSEPEWERAIRERQKAETRKLMATNPLGAVILKLKREEEELLDTVWLATSPKQIRDLWKGVAELVSSEPTGLQMQALEGNDDSSEA